MRVVDDVGNFPNFTACLHRKVVCTVVSFNKTRQRMSRFLQFLDFSKATKQFHYILFKFFERS